MEKKTIAEHMRDILIEKGMDTVGYGSLDELDACATRCKHSKLSDLSKGSYHPLTRHKRILDALDRSPLFRKFLFRLDTFQNNQSRLCRAFTLVESPVIDTGEIKVSETGKFRLKIGKVDMAIERVL